MPTFCLLLPCRSEDREKYNALVRKESEVNAYLDAFSELKHDLTTAQTSQSAENRELRHRIARYREMAETADPDQSALAAMRSTLEYKQLQAKNSTETSVRIYSTSLVTLRYPARSTA